MNLLKRPLLLCRLRTSTALPALLAAASLVGCSSMKPKILTHYVYVTAKSTFLRDRIAAVSNRTGNVSNGQRLEILQSNKRFYQVRTDKGEVGWIDEKAVATEAVSKEFDDLNAQHEKDVPVASGVVRDDVYLHTKPGRDTDKLYRLDEGDKLKLLARASTLKPQPPGMPVAPTPVPAGKGKGKATPVAAAAPEAPEPPPMEDWWLVRDTHGHTGWMLSRMLDVDVPDSVARYAENQRIVGAYVLNMVNDPEIEGASKDVPNYVVVLSPFKAGLPYDFNQLRVFYWNTKHHRYEGANRDRNILGYLPVKIGTDPGTTNPQKGSPFVGPAPSYSYTVLAAGAPLPQPNPQTGMWTPPKNQLITKTYRLEGNNTRRVLPPGTTPPAEAQLAPEEKKDKKGKKRR
ncbi:SH3 domain-containing protein [Terriglobus aquaticus]|uniref:SH3 domain-containing protein n=1 Tax=Terriglobus aquaticus TaxID=940139 RepID=A0ABW9KIU1_9BACT|nr:SH3 domain-containing protein [Terriglobus aquaticus]